MEKKLSFRGPILLVVLDGVGLGTRSEGNAVAKAHTEFLNRVFTDYLDIPLAASGEAVGVMKGDMGNSEIGHNALGSGQIVKQSAARVEEAFETGEVWESRGWKECVENVKNKNSTLHFSGIFSDGNVHSNIRHLEMMVRRANAEGINKIRLHCVFDGRDVSPQSEPKYIERIERLFAEFPDADYKIASGAGRMVAVADRYENDWGIVKRGWDMMVHGEAAERFSSAKDAIRVLREKDPSVQDQYLPAFVIDQNGEPVGRVEDGDSFIYYDFRADRAIEIAMAFTYHDFPYFDRGRVPDVCFAGMMEYNSDTHVPFRTLVPPTKIEHTLNEYLGRAGISQLAISETCKFGHITYYFNGNSYDPAPGEMHIEIPSDSAPFNTRPWMKAAEITDAVLENMEKYQFIRVNYPGGDMVGHFGEIESTMVAVEAIDISLRRLAEKVDALGGMMIITADHGNAEELIDETGKPKTSHTTNKVPCMFYDNTKNRNHYVSARLADPGLSNIAATVATLFGLTDFPLSWRPSLIKPVEELL
ncbi:2,3-bisphosphoglycerate-independent phosphoglycerate mutase [Candidatus Saccharibacteria bacterium]|nr:2,3-bisphosphoglycerate-independent phosphoglycerate mutase [Candidatus Saccharibacteria bacterium]